MSPKPTRRPESASRDASPLPELGREEIRRYSRHLILPDVGLNGQRRLKAGRVLLIGMGGLGSPLALYLAAAGVGTLGLVDDDIVDESNLQRQVIHGTPDVGRSKVLSGRESILAVNPHVQVVVHEDRLTSQNAMAILADYDVVVDGTDNFATRYLTNDACVLLGKPNVYGSVFRFEGQASVFGTQGGPCYRCLYPAPPPSELVPNCAEGGVLGVLPGLIGMIQATETLKLLLGIGDTLAGKLLLYDALEMSFRTLRLNRNPACPVCGDHPTIRELVDYEEFCGNGRGDPGAEDAVMTVHELKTLREGGEKFTLLDVREPFEAQLVSLPGSKLIPLRELAGRLGELDAGSRIVAYCHHGIRSASAAALLRSAGFSRVHNLVGGIDAWAMEIEKEMARY